MRNKTFVAKENMNRPPGDRFAISRPEDAIQSPGSVSTGKGKIKNTFRADNSINETIDVFSD